MKKNSNTPVSPLLPKRRSISGNLVTILMVVILYAVVCYLLYTGQASRQMARGEVLRSEAVMGGRG